MANRQQAVIQPFFLFVDEDYNDYDLTRQAVVPLFSLFDDDGDDDYNNYEKQNQSWSDDNMRTIMKCNNDVYYGNSSFAQSQSDPTDPTAVPSSTSDNS